MFAGEFNFERWGLDSFEGITLATRWTTRVGVLGVLRKLELAMIDIFGR